MNTRRHILLIYIFLGFLVNCSMSSKTIGVVFQSFSIDEDTVQCYGSCERDNKGEKEFKLSRCEGSKIRLSCTIGYQIKINKATSSNLSPDLDICTSKNRKTCVKDVTNAVKKMCTGQTQCVINSSRNKVRNSCSNTKYIAMDITYTCELKPNTMLPTTKVPEKNVVTTRTIKVTSTVTTQKTVPSKMLIKTTPAELKRATFKIRTLRSDIDIPVVNTKSSVKPTIVKIADSNLGESDMFWSMTAYTAITNSEFMKKNKTHLALALLLSMFVGMVLCLCFFLDYCRRAKKKKEKQSIQGKLVITPDSQIIDPKEHIELARSKMVEVITCNGSLPRHKIIGCGDHAYLNNNNEDEDDDLYSVSAPFFKRSLEHKSLAHHHLHGNQERLLSPSSLPPPPNHFLLESTSSSSDDRLPPTNNYSKEDNDNIDRASINDFVSPGSGTNTLLSQQNSVPLDKDDSELVEVEEIYLEEETLNDLESSPYEFVEFAQYHASDEYSSSPHVPRSVAYHRTDNYVVSPKAKLALLNRRTTSNDETSQEESLIRTLDSKRLRRSNQKEKPLIQKSKSFDEPKKKAYFTLNNHYLMKNPRRGRVHVMQRCTETLPRRATNMTYNNTYSQKGIYSDNEASRRTPRRRHDMDHKRSCSCQQGLDDLYCGKCGKPEQSHIKCCSSLTSNCQSSSHDEGGEENRGPLLSISNELIKNKQCCVEESGYQSHDTGTDSMCSSSFSTDQEDSRMFLPSSLSNDRHNGCRSKSSCHIRGHDSKRDPRFIVVRDHSKNKMPRRMRHDEYIRANAHTHDNRSTSKLDVHPYDSSMDDASSRDSVKLFRKINKQNMPNDELFDDVNCDFVSSINSPDTGRRMDGIETS